MNQLCKVIGLTYGEFQSWFNYGEIRLTIDRIVSITRGSEGMPNPECPFIPVLLERLPQLAIDDEEGAILINIDQSYNIKTNYLDIKTLYIPIESIQHVIPLTERARRILQPRLEKFGIKLSEALFNDQVEVVWAKRSVRNALRGGDALIKAIFETDTDPISNELRRSLEIGIRRLDWPDVSDSQVVSENRDIYWVAEMFNFTRHEPYNYGDLNPLVDAGLVLKASVESEEDVRIRKYREVLKPLLNKNVPTKNSKFFNVLNDSRFESAIERTSSVFPEIPKAGLLSLIMFLRWKEFFHQQGDELDIERLIADSRELSSSFDFDTVITSVWLLGCFAGHERVAHFLYNSNPELFPWFSQAENLFLDKLSKPIMPEAVDAEDKNHEENDLVSEGPVLKVEEAANDEIEGAYQDASTKNESRVSIHNVAFSSLTVVYNRESGFLGHTIKTDNEKKDIVVSCSEYDKLFLIFSSGMYKITSVPDKLFVGHELEWFGTVESDQCFNMVYNDGETNTAYVKRFVTPKFILGKEYSLFTQHKRSKILLLVLGQEKFARASLVPSSRAKSNAFEIDFKKYLIKGATAKGRKLCTREVRQVVEANSIENSEKKSKKLSLPGIKFDAKEGTDSAAANDEPIDQ